MLQRSNEKNDGSILTLIVPAAVTCVNVAFNRSMRLLAQFECHHSANYREAVIFSRLFVRLLLNTAVLIVLINADLDWLYRCACFALI